MGRSKIRHLFRYIRKYGDYLMIKITNCTIDVIPDGWKSIVDGDNVHLIMSGDIEIKDFDDGEGCICGSCSGNTISIYIEAVIYDAIVKFYSGDYKFKNPVKALIYTFALTVAHEVFHVIDNKDRTPDEINQMREDIKNGKINHDIENKIDAQTKEFMDKYGQKIIKRVMKGKNRC